MRIRETILTALSICCLCASCALADMARIETGGGALNMRRKTDAKSAVLERIPNGTMVEIKESGDTWSQVVYKGKTGYVKTEYVKPVTQEELRREQEKKEAASQKPAETAAPKVLIQTGGSAWTLTSGGKLNLRRKADGKSAVIEHIPSGARVQVEEAEEIWSRITYKGKTGHVKTEYLRLDSQMIGKTIYPDGEYLYLRREQDENAACITSVHASQPMTILEISRDWVKVSAQNPYLGDVQGYVSLEDISMWREAPADPAVTAYYAQMSLSGESLVLGNVLDAVMQCAHDAVCQYTVYHNGKAIYKELEIEARNFSYRPKESGRYRIEAKVSGPMGENIACQAIFDVQEHTGAVFQAEPYSQKDGWWLDKKYGKRNLDSSGCAIFTLSHALHLLGRSGEETMPENLALTYPMYLAESGTVTSGLLNAAGRAFNFSTSKDKMTKKAEIVQRFEEGAVFSFSPAEGHIALAAALSEDSTMVKVIDSAPSATMERIKDASLYYRDEQGGYHAVRSLWEIPGAKYYFETNEFGGLTYYMDLDYVVRRGVRMIRSK